MIKQRELKEKEKKKKAKWKITIKRYFEREAGWGGGKEGGIHKSMW